MFKEDEQTEKLLADERHTEAFGRMLGRIDGTDDEVRIGKGKKRISDRDASRDHKRDRRGEEGELLYEMEEEGRRSEFERPRDSSGSEQQRPETVLVVKAVWYCFYAD